MLNSFQHPICYHYRIPKRVRNDKNKAKTVLNGFLIVQQRGEKMKKRFLSLIIICLISNYIFAETNSEKFWELWNDKKTEDAASFLASWQKKDKKDPELYVCYFNMYINQASKEQMHIEPFLPENYNGQYIEGQNENGEKLYIYSVIEYDAELCNKAFEYIDLGLTYNPKRLDMHFGKAHLYFMLEDYAKQADAIKKVFELNKKYKDSWLWTDNERITSAGIGFEESIHEYILKWYGTKNASTYPLMKEIALLYVEQFPYDVVAYNDAGISAMLMKDLKTAKEYFTRGYELDSSDMLLLGNLARVCYNLGEKDASKKYYEIMAASQNTEESEYAKQILNEYF